MKMLNVGDRVAYSVQWLRSVGLSATDESCHARGQIIEVKEYGSESRIAKIRWDNPNIPDHVNCGNLASVGPNDKFCAC